MTYVETLSELGLLLIYYPESEVDLVGLVKVWGNGHDLRKGFLGVIVASVSIVQNSNAVPQRRVL